ncbi:unnamed protein product [Symbiodinium microadriaticum]|nr:unnamed protein product [Symbiodinium microadriaticum]
MRRRRRRRGSEDVVVHGILVREMGTRLVLAVSASAWHKKVNRRTLLRGFLTEVAAAEVLACTATARASPVDDYVIWVWSGLVEPVSEQSIEVSDDPVTVGFGNLSTAKPVLPFIPSLVAAVNDHFTCLSRERRRCSVQGALDPSVLLAARNAEEEVALGGGGLLVDSGKYQIVRRALREALLNSPGDLASVIERLMAEDLGAEACLTHLREQIDFNENRQKLNKVQDRCELFAVAKDVDKGLGMGDHAAVDIAEESHVNLLRAFGAMRDGEVLRYRDPMPYPESGFLESVMIDDHLGLQLLKRLPSMKRTLEQPARDQEVFASSASAYDYANLMAHPKKQRRSLHVKAWGAEMEGGFDWGPQAFKWGSKLRSLDKVMFDWCRYSRPFKKSIRPDALSEEEFRFVGSAAFGSACPRIPAPPWFWKLRALNRWLLLLATCCWLVPITAARAPAIQQPRVRDHLVRGRVTALTHKIRTNLLKDVQQYGWLRSSLAGPWNLIRTWEQLEPVQHHPPMPLMVVYALAITAQLWKWPRMAVALILAIYGSLRPAEIIGLRRRIWHCRGITSTTKQRCDTERLLYTTCSGHPGAASWILDRRRSALDTWPEIWNGSWAAFKLRFDALQTEVLEGTPFLPSSLRPGAATFLFSGYAVSFLGALSYAAPFSPLLLRFGKRASDALALRDSRWLHMGGSADDLFDFTSTGSFSELTTAVASGGTEFIRAGLATSHNGSPSEDFLCSASALRQNIQSKGENAYYYAHNRQFEVPPEARVISGPGLVTGGPPVKLEVEAGQFEQSSERQVHTLRNFSWTDDGTKVKVYVQLPPDVLQDVSQVTCDFAPRRLHIQVTPTSGAVYVCKVEPLYSDIVPETSSFRTNVEKAKVSVAMQKKNGSQLLTTSRLLHFLFASVSDALPRTAPQSIGRSFELRACHLSQQLEDRGQLSVDSKPDQELAKGRCLGRLRLCRSTR